MKNDKKRVGINLSVIIPNKDLIMVKVDDVTDDEFILALKEVKKVLFS